jgi:hypothetical protein
MDGSQSASPLDSSFDGQQEEDRRTHDDDNVHRGFQPLNEFSKSGNSVWEAGYAEHAEQQGECRQDERRKRKTPPPQGPG